MDDDDFGFIPPRRLQKMDVVIVGVEFLRHISSAFTSAFASCVALAAAHANYKTDQEEFRAQVAQDIETITGEQDG